MHFNLSLDDLEDLMSRANNGTSLDYELFRKTDQVDSFLRQVQCVYTDRRPENIE